MNQPGNGEFVRTHPLAIVATGFDSLRRMLFPLLAAAAALATREHWSMWMIVPAAILFVAIPIAAAALQWVFLRYRVGPEDIRVESGVISREARAVPYERIQDVSIGETVASRVLGLVSVKFETGAGGKDEIALSYVTKDEGDRLRELVRERRGEAADEPLEIAETVEPPPVFAMKLPRVLEFGLYEFSLVFFAVLFAALQQLEFLLPFDPWDNELWSSLWQEQGERVRSLRVSAQIASFVLATIGVFLAGVLTGVTRTLLREYDFRLDRTAKGFRRRRGLITRTDLVMPVHRVQAALVTTGFIRRRVGNWHGLKFVSLASDGAKSSNHAMAPFATMEEIDPIARIAGIALPDGSEEWHATSARYWFDRAALRVVPLLVLAAIIALAGETLAALAPFAVALAFALGSLVKFRHYRHAAAHGEVFVRGGFLKPRLQVAPQYKLHTVEIEQSVLARWRGYATLNMGLAGGPMRIVGMPGQQAWTLRKDLLEKIVSTDFSQLPSAQPST